MQTTMGANMTAKLVNLHEVKNKNPKFKWLITAADWKLHWAENKVKKDCAARKKRQEKGLDPISYRNIWNHIKQTTWMDDKCQK